LHEKGLGAYALQRSKWWHRLCKSESLTDFFAMTPFPTTQTLHNFLFMLPFTTTRAEQEIIMNLARRLTSLGYVYIASAHECTMEDREEIRFMPLHCEMLPAFGTLTGVFVVKDADIASVARDTYPDAHVLVIDPARVEEDLPEYDPVQVISSWPSCKAPWTRPVREVARALSAA
jgi:hypothetical protein